MLQHPTVVEARVSIDATVRPLPDELCIGARKAYHISDGLIKVQEIIEFLMRAFTLVFLLLIVRICVGILG
jgi:hypothetical protein